MKPNAGRGCRWSQLATSHPLSVSENKLQSLHSHLIIFVSSAAPLSPSGWTGNLGTPGFHLVFTDRSHLGAS